MYDSNLELSDWSSITTTSSSREYFLVALLARETESNLESVVGPAAELHLAPLVVEGEPRDVDLAGRLEDTGRHVQAGPVVPHHHVGLVCSVESLIRTVVHQHVRLPDAMRRDAQILHATIVRGVPAQIHVVPLQFQPHIRDQQLIFLVLRGEIKERHPKQDVNYTRRRESSINN